MSEIKKLHEKQNTIQSDLQILREENSQICLKLSKVLSNKELINEIFNCMICKSKVTVASEPMVPNCCSSTIVCKPCVLRWLEESSSCPHCRCDLEIEGCTPMPLLRPIIAQLEMDVQHNE